MRKLLLLPLVLCLSIQSQAGFFTSFLASSAANYITSPSSSSQRPQTTPKSQKNKKKIISKREASKKLWRMHKNGVYGDNYMALINIVKSQSDSVGDLDTIAYAYIDNGHAQEALDIYKKILPALSKLPTAKKQKYQRHYSEIKMKANNILSPKDEMSSSEEKEQVTPSEEKKQDTKRAFEYTQDHQ